MKLFHLSDLHIGKRVNEFSMLEDQKYILMQILKAAKEHQPDGIILAGDIYDKPVPAAEAVQVFDDFLTSLNEMGLIVFMISGNHDSPERVSYGGRLMKKSGIYVAPVYEGKTEKVEFTDAYGKVCIHLLPFVKPAVVRHAFEEGEFEKEADFKIIYIYQENAGKHSAINRALQETTSELFLIADSDDSFKANALEVFINTWESIPEGERNQYKGVIAKCYNAEDGTPIGSYPQHMFDSNDLDAYFVQRLCFEKWNIVRTDVMKELPFPEPNEKLKFYPESVVWWRMARKYKTRYIDENIRAYYHDQENSVIKQSTGRARETIYLWRFYINEAMDYFWKYPKAFVKAYIGYSRDNIRIGRKYSEAISSINGIYRKVLVTCGYPIGYVLAIRKGIVK